MSQKFQKRQENFICDYCGETVRGDGYTNHCPECLWSKHVDVYPGDRAASCGGLMKPIGFMTIGGGHTIIHRCLRCRTEKRNKMNQRDNLSLLARLN